MSGEEIVERAFPSLRQAVWKLTSPETKVYNCIAWAAGDDKRWWWPLSPGGHWPKGLPNSTSLSTFTALFETLGFGETLSPTLEAETAKIALYAVGDEVKHAARQLESGAWTSKLGRGVDIEHELKGLEGSGYGKVVAFFKRKSTAEPSL